MTASLAVAMTSSTGQKLGQWRKWGIVWLWGMREKRKHVMFHRPGPQSTRPTSPRLWRPKRQNVQRKRTQRSGRTTFKACGKRGEEEICRYVGAHIVQYIHTENHAMLSGFGRVHLTKGENGSTREKKQTREHINNCYFYLLLLQTYTHS